MKRKDYTYVVYEKTFFERLGRLIFDETNIMENDDINELIKQLARQNINISRRGLFKALKNGSTINKKYLVYKIKK